MSRRKQAKPRALKREEEWPPEGCGAGPVAAAAAAPGDALLNGDSEMPAAGAEAGGAEEAAASAADSGSGSGSDGDGGGGDARSHGDSVAAAGDGGGLLLGVPGDLRDPENSLESDALGTDPGSSWRSDTPDDQTSRSPSSCATPNSATDVPDAELTFTVGVTEGTPYACQFCERAFPRLSYLKKHEQTHSDQMPFRCDFCSRLFKHKRSRDRHIKLHTGDKKYRCTHCEAAFSRSDHLKIHMKTHDTQKPFQCAVCNRGYNTAAALTSHMQSHKKEGGGGGGGSGSGGGSSSAHSSPSPAGFRCLVCGAAFRRSDELQAHALAQHAVAAPPASPLDGLLQGLGLGLGLLPALPKLACIYCTKDSFTSMEALQLHVQAMHRAILNGDVRGMSGPGEAPSRHTPPQRSPQHQPHQQQQHQPAAPQQKGALAPPPQSPQQGQGGREGREGREAPAPAPALAVACELCTMRFSSSHALQRHVQTVHALDLGSRFCGDCVLPLASAAQLAEHRARAHGSEQLRPTDLSKKPAPSPAHVHAPTPAATPARTPPTGPAPAHAPAPPAHASALAPGATPPPAHAASEGGGGGGAGGGPPDAKRARTAAVADLPAGTLLCNQCGAALPDFESFRAHLKSHLEEAAAESPAQGSPPGGGGRAGPPSVAAASHACPHCGVAFEDAATCEAHVADHFLATSTEFGCASCMKLFAQPDELQKHLMDMHAHHLYRCALCRDVFDSKVAIQVHFAVKHSSQCTLFRCTACPPSAAAVFRSQLDFALHVRATHAPPPPPPPPPLPSAPLPLPLPLPQPPSSQHSSPSSQAQAGPFRCLFCRLSFGTELEMQLHLAVHSKQFRCPLCQEAFHVEFLLDKHLQTAHSSHVMSNGPRSPPSDAAAEGLLKSGEGRGGSSGSNSERGDADGDHSGSRKSSSGGGIASSGKATGGGSNSSGGGAVSLHCAYCNENCKSRTELENHMKTHSAGAGGGGKHKCNICDELCPSAAVLAEHKLTHCKVVSGNACTQCKAGLASEEQFFAHLQQHAAASGGGGATSPGQSAPLPAPCVVCRQTLLSDMEARLHARFHLQRAAGAEAAAAAAAAAAPVQCCVCLQPLSNGAGPVGGGAGGARAPLCRDCARRERARPTTPPKHSAPPPPALTPTSTPANPATPPAGDVDSKTYQCIKCQVSFDSEPEIQRHVASHVLAEGASLECRLCRRVLASPLKLQAHLIEHTFAGCGAFTCYLCSAVFTAAGGLQAHMLQHGLHARPYDCSRCALRFFFRAELEHHSYSHLERDAQQAAAAAAAVAAADLAGKVAYYQQQQPQHSAANGGYESLDGLYFKTEEPTSPPNGAGGGGGGGGKLRGGGGSGSGSGSKASRGGRAVSCPDCGKTCAHPRALAAHRQRHHAPRPASPAAPPTPNAVRVKEEPASSDEAAGDGEADADRPADSTAVPADNANAAAPATDGAASDGDASANSASASSASSAASSPPSP